MYTQTLIVDPQHIDALEHAHYRVFQDFAEVVQIELTKKLGIDIESLREKDLALFIREVHVIHRGQLKQDDEVEVTVWIKDVKKLLIIFACQVRKKEKIVADIKFTTPLVQISQGKLLPIPQWMKEICKKS